MDAKSVAINIEILSKEVDSCVESLQNAELLFANGISEKYDKLWFILKGTSQSQILLLVESYSWTSDYNYEINELLNFHQVVQYSKTSTN
jgi:predicted nucleotide-binding protein (sugar kinase/HSP70/actin superfamily)